MLRVILMVCLLVVPLQLSAQTSEPDDSTKMMCRENFLMLKGEHKGVIVSSTWWDLTDIQAYEAYIDTLILARHLHEAVRIRECLPADQIGKHE